MPYFLMPWIPLGLNFFVFFATYLLYEVKFPEPLTVLLVAAYSLAAIFGILIIKKNHRRWLLPEGKVNFPRATAVIVIICSLLEYTYFGVPLAGKSLYVDFGFPLLHHISVSSWILLFIAQTEHSKLARTTLRLFSVINPILMLNRDVLLLTVFCAVVLRLQRQRIKPRTLIIFLILAITCFGLVGQIRSPFALASVFLPFSFDTTDIPPLIMWPLIYITSSSFNMLANFETLDVNLYSDFINVFPESYRWATPTRTYIAIPLYYTFATWLLWHVRKLSERRHEWVPFYVFLVYQAYMSVFSVKIFTTNTIFVALAITIAAHISSLRKNKSHQAMQSEKPN